MCIVYLKDICYMVSIPSEHLEPVTPTRRNKVGPHPRPLLYPGPPNTPPTTACSFGDLLDPLRCYPSPPGTSPQPLWDPPSTLGSPLKAHSPPICPPPQVKVILGEDREATGILVDIDGEEGVVRMDLEEQFKILNLRSLGKLVEA